jgi:hypothetical protein
VRDRLDVDRVILLEGAVGSEANVEYSQRLTEKLETDFSNLLGAETERVGITDVYDYDAAFEQAYRLINTELDVGADIWVNVSAMPRTVSFAYATAAHSIMVEREEDRDRIRTYYTVPERYLETDLAEELRSQIRLLEDILSEGVDEERVREGLRSARSLIAEFDERGTTIGAKEVDGSHVVEFPVASFTSVKPFEELVLFTLGEYGEFESVSELASTLADDLSEEYTDAFRSKVLYNVDRLGPGGKGYIEQEAHGKSYRTSLSRIGALWVRAHADADTERMEK